MSSHDPKNATFRCSMRAGLVALCSLLAGLSSTGAAAADPSEAVRRIFERELPNVPGKSMTSLIVEYAPGASSRPHRHADSGFLFAYVLSGAIRSQVDDGPVKVYEAGEHWYEGPGARHTVSENASKTEPARLLVVFVAGTGDRLTTYDAR